MLRIRLFGGLAVDMDGQALPPSLFAGRQGRLVLAYLACSPGRNVGREELAEVLWPAELADSWPTSLSAVVSRLRRLFAEAGLDPQRVLVSTAGGYQLQLPDAAWIDWHAAHQAVDQAERALDGGDPELALAAAGEAAELLAGGFLTDDCEWVDRQRETAHDLTVRAAAAKAAAHLAAGSPRRAVEDARAALRLDPLREATFRLLMQALVAAGERAEALRVWEHCRTTLVEELGVDPSPETEAVYLEVLDGAPPPEPAPARTTALPSGVVTFLLTDIVDSTVLWERQPAAMAEALERHDAVVADVVTAHGGTVLKSKLEGDATVSVFARATGGAYAALALQDALDREPWPEGAAPRVRMALHTGEAFERAGDYFGPALNRAARLRSLADGGQVLLSQAVAELVVDHLPEGVALADRGHRDLRGLSRGENVFELVQGDEALEVTAPAPFERPGVPGVLAPSGPFVGRADEVATMLARWQEAEGGTPRAVLLGGEPGVGKSRLAAEAATTAHDGGGIVLYGRCDEELGAPLQPFVEALRPLVPALGASRLRCLRGIDELSRIVPEVAELLPEVKRTSQADPDTERYALFDAITRLLAAASAEAPVLLVLDDLHWAGKTTLALLRHLLRNAEQARLLVVGTYRDTELARTHPLADMLADLHRDGTAEWLTLGGLGADDVVAYLEAVGRHDRALGRELAQVTSGNPFFLIETLRHVEETGGAWDKGSLPQGVRQATGRRLSRLSEAANDALGVAAVAGSAFSLELVEAVRGTELVDEIGEACQAGLVLEEPGALGRFRFAHALVRQVLLAELVTVKRVRLHRAIAELLEAEAGDDLDDDAVLTELAHHWFECASAGNAEKAVAYCRRAADRAVERLAHEEAADLYDMALQALEGADDADLRAELLLARCESLLTAGEVGPARAALDALQRAAGGDPHLAAWHAVYAGQLAVLGEPDRLTEIVASIGAAATAMREQGDTVGEAKAHYVHALALDRLGQIGAAERALDAALGSARQAGDRRLADAVLAGAPQAALWGPSPVARASGRCLDVVRVLRITSGAPAVEAVALRCQAVLEALRGRSDAARKMIASSRRTLDELGLAHRLLETEVMAGLIELLDQQPEAAEALLRPAFEDLRDRGLGGEAALAGALLGRALLQQQRDNEAEAVAEEAALLAGADLKAAITWRGVLAEAAARRGDTGRALELARAAVELATGTDALLLVADARRSLAAVLRLAGDGAAAAAETRRTAEACEAKGATALAERARRALAQPAPATPPTPVPASHVAVPLTNAAIRMDQRWREAWDAGDWDRVEALYAPSSQMLDRQRLGSGDLSVEQALAQVRLFFETGSVRWTAPEVLATRGDRLFLARQSTQVLDPAGAVTAETLMLCLHGADEQGRRDLTVTFDEDDLDAAFEELDRRYAEGEAASAPDEWRTLREFIAAVNDADEGRLREALAPEFVAYWHALEPANVDHFVEYHLGWQRDYPGTRIRRVHVTVEPGRALLVGEINVPGQADVQAVVVYAFDAAGRLRANWSYRSDDLDEALEEAWRRYHELGRGAPSAPFVNAAVRLEERFHAAWESRDWDRVVALFAPTWHLRDNRRASTGALGVDDSFRSLRYLFDAGSLRWRVEEVLATRGDRLVLCRRVAETLGKDGAVETEVSYLDVYQVDELGRRELSVDFDEDQLDAAFGELDQLYAEGEAASAPAAWRGLRALDAAINAADRDRMLACLAPGFEGVVASPVVDRVARGPEEFVDYLLGLTALRSDARTRYQHVLALEPDRALVTATRGVTEDFEVDAALVYRLDADGRVLRLWGFTTDQLDDAWRRYREIGQPDQQFHNAAIRNHLAIMEAWEARDWGRVEALHAGWHDDDRRTLGAGYVPPDEMRSTLRYAFETMKGRWVPAEFLATRGDRLVLLRGGWDAPDDGPQAAGQRALSIFRVDEQGRREYSVDFDEDDLDAAFDELDRLFLEGEGARAKAFWERHSALTQAVNNADRNAALACLSPDFRFAGHGLLGWGELDGPGFIAHTVETFALKPDAEIRTRHVLALDERRSLTVATNSVVGDYEVMFANVTQADADSRIVRRDSYGLYQLDEAWRHYRSLVAADVPVGERFPNTATRRMRAVTEARNRRDFGAFAALFAPSYRIIFKTRLAAAELDYGQYMENMHRRLDDRRDMAWEDTPLATRGDRLALVRLRFEGTWEDVGHTVLDQLMVVAVDDAGRGVSSVVFDADDIDAAYEELDRRFLDGEGAVVRSLYERGLAFARAIDAEDDEAAADWLSPGFRFETHRALGWGDLDGAGFVAHARTLKDMRGDSRLRATHVLAFDHGRSISVGGFQDASGTGEFEFAIVGVNRADADGRLVSRDVYDLDQLDQAWAQYEEIGRTETPIGERFPNAATR